MASNSSSWNKTFHEVFGCLQDKWNTITEGNIKSMPHISVACHDGWEQFQVKGEVHFECGVCKRSWSSVNGAVVFHYRLRRETGQGEVKIWCFGQKCKRQGCDEFQDPLWYETEIKRALGNLLIKVKETFYEGPKKAVNTNQLDGNMAAGHETALCQAFQKGMCGLRDGYSASAAAGGAFKKVHHDEDYTDKEYLDLESDNDYDDDYDNCSDENDDYGYDDYANDNIDFGYDDYGYECYGGY